MAASFLRNGEAMTTNVYIDGFNLYYNALKGTRYRWLDIDRLVFGLIPLDQVNRICYFTAPVQIQNGDGGPRQRQSVYWDALRTLPKVEIIEGTFRDRRKRGVIVEPPVKVQRIVTISTPEEKQTDVNIATEMIFDAFTNACDKAVVISNDADLSRSILRVRTELQVEVIVVNPSKAEHSPRALFESASSVRQLEEHELQMSQFPATVMTYQGRAISKPASW